jgi:hypothetical protein
MVVTSFAESESERGNRDVEIEGSYHKYSNFSKRIDEVHKALRTQTRINVWQLRTTKKSQKER